LIISSDLNGSPIGIAPDGYIWVSRGDSQPLLVAEDFEAFLNLCLEPDSGHLWLMIHPAIAAAPVKPQLSLVLFALSEASRLVRAAHELGTEEIVASAANTLFGRQ
jgi:hypothetical protein